jgi:ribosomal protein S18 acetylase RimI-like enzyme
MSNGFFIAVDVVLAHETVFSRNMRMDMLTRPYRKSDEEAVVSLWKRTFPNTSPWNEPHADIRRKLTVQRELFLVAEIDGQLVGTAMAGFDGHRGWVYLLAVDEAHRRKGIATQLVRRAEQNLAALGCVKLNLMVRTSDLDVLPFYEKLGFGHQEVVTLGKLLKEKQ